MTRPRIAQQPSCILWLLLRRGPRTELSPLQAWAKEELAALNADEAISTPNSVNYALNVLWLERNIGMAVDQVFGEVSTPLQPGFEGISCLWWGQQALHLLHVAC